MNFIQTPATDYSFVGRAGQQLGNMVEAIPGAIRADKIASQLKYDVSQAKDDYQKLIDQAKNLYKQETGETDEVKATAFVVKYFQPMIGSEYQDPVKAVTRWEAADPAFKAAIKQEKVKAFSQKSASVAQPAPTVQPTQPTTLAGQQAQPAPQQKPMFQNELMQKTFDEATRPKPDTGFTPQYSGNTTPPPAPVVAPAPVTKLAGQTADEMQAEAESKSIADDPNIQRQINTQRNREWGKKPPTGNRAQAMEGTLAGQGGWTPEQKTAMEARPTELQYMTNARLAKAQEENARIKGIANRLKGKKLASDERLDIMKEKDKNDKNRASVQTQIAAISARANLANKDFMGQIDPTALKKIDDDLQDLQGSLAVLDNNSELLDGLLAEKGDIEYRPLPKGNKSGKKPLTAFETK